MLFADVMERPENPALEQAVVRLGEIRMDDAADKLFRVIDGVVPPIVFPDPVT